MKKGGSEKSLFQVLTVEPQKQRFAKVSRQVQIPYENLNQVTFERTFHMEIG